jgi:hypothetical protein
MSASAIFRLPPWSSLARPEPPPVRSLRLVARMRAPRPCASFYGSLEEDLARHEGAYLAERPGRFTASLDPTHRASSMRSRWPANRCRLRRSTGAPGSRPVHARCTSSIDRRSRRDLIAASAGYRTLCESDRWTSSHWRRSDGKASPSRTARSRKPRWLAGDTRGCLPSIPALRRVDGRGRHRGGRAG